MRMPARKRSSEAGSSSRPTVGTIRDALACDTVVSGRLAAFAAEWPPHADLGPRKNCQAQPGSPSDARIRGAGRWIPRMGPDSGLLLSSQLAVLAATSTPAILLRQEAHAPRVAIFSGLRALSLAFSGSHGDRRGDMQAPTGSPAVAPIARANL
jgi:hypothetical protein